MDQEYRLLDYAVTYWSTHLERISALETPDVIQCILRFFLSGQAFFSWVYARGVIHRGRNNGSEIQLLWNEFKTIDLAIVTRVMNMVSSAMPARNLDWSPHELDESLCRNISFPLYALDSLKQSDPHVEACLASLIFERLRPGSSDALLPVSENSETEDYARFWTNFAAMEKALRDQSRSQFKSLLIMACAKQLHQYFEYSSSPISGCIRKRV